MASNGQWPRSSIVRWGFSILDADEKHIVLHSYRVDIKASYYCLVLVQSWRPIKTNLENRHHFWAIQ